MQFACGCLNIDFIGQLIPVKRNSFIQERIKNNSFIIAINKFTRAYLDQNRFSFIYFKTYFVHDVVKLIIFTGLVIYRTEPDAFRRCYGSFSDL